MSDDLKSAAEAELWAAFEAGHFAWPTHDAPNRRAIFETWLAGRPAPPLADSQDERLIHALRLVRSVIDELAEDVCGDDVTPELRGQPTPFGQFDAGHLCAAETLIGGHLSEDASARYAKEDEHRRWQNVVKTITSRKTEEPAPVAEGAPRERTP